MNFNTALLHDGVDKKEKYGSTLTPIYQTSAFFQQSAEDLAGIFGGKNPGYCYTRVQNPTIAVFENRINKLEGGIGTVATASGMAAIFRPALLPGGTAMLPPLLAQSVIVVTKPISCRDTTRLAEYSWPPTKVLSVTLK